jgi:hypothetical protein
MTMRCRPLAPVLALFVCAMPVIVNGPRAQPEALRES